MTEKQEKQSNKINFFFMDDHGSLLNDQEWILRGGILISVSDYHLLSRLLNRLNQDKFGKSEVKWSDIHAVIYCKNNNIPIKESKKFFYLEKYEIDFLENYIIQFYETLNKFDFKVVVSVGKREFLKTAHTYFLEFQIEDLMQRIQYENQKQDSLSIFVHDSCSNNEDHNIKHYYKKLIKDSRMVKDFSRIIDNLFIEFSHMNPGIQASDFILGTISGVFRDYKFSQKLYRDFLQSKMRTNSKGDIFGYGIILTTQSKNLKLKELLTEKLDKSKRDDESV